MDLPTPYTDHWLTDSPPSQNHSLRSQISLFWNWNLPSQSHIKASDHSPRPPVLDPIHSRARQESGRREEDGRRSLEGPTYSRVGAELGGGCGQTLSNRSESEVSILRMPSWLEPDSEAPREIIRRCRPNGTICLFYAQNEVNKRSEFNSNPTKRYKAVDSECFILKSLKGSLSLN